VLHGDDGGGGGGGDEEHTKDHRKWVRYVRAWSMAEMARGWVNCAREAKIRKLVGG
jgi:hypothetical protein